MWQSSSVYVSLQGVAGHILSVFTRVSICFFHFYKQLSVLCVVSPRPPYISDLELSFSLIDAADYVEPKVKRMDLSLIIHIDEVTNVWPLLSMISLFYPVIMQEVKSSAARHHHLWGQVTFEDQDGFIDGHLSTSR